MDKHISELRGSSVCILTPANTFAPPYVESLFALVQESGRVGIKINFITSAGSHVGQLREKIMCDYFFSGNSHDFCFWIDSDISFTVDDFFELLCSPYMVTSGVYLISTDGRTSIARNGRHLTSEEIKKFPKYISVDASGMGFMCIKKEVFDSVSAPYFSNIMKSDNETVETGEDTAWCEKLRQSGFEVACNTRVRLGHHKSSIWSISNGR